MRLDVLAVEASRCLVEAGLPHLLLKGPTTARWLYDPPRLYRDVDLLVPGSRLELAALALARAGLAERAGGRLGEEASHSLLLRSPSGLELDLHVTLPMLQRVPGDRQDALWRGLAGHVEPFVIDGVAVPALDAPARCLVVALHALGNGPRDEQSLEDLRRARSVEGAVIWRECHELASELGSAPLIPAALSLVEPLAPPTSLPVDVRLRMAGGAGAAFQLERLAQAPLRALPALLWRELLPSRGFMRYAEPERTTTRPALVCAYVRRWRRLARELPSEWSRWRALRRE